MSLSKKMVFGRARGKSGRWENEWRAQVGPTWTFTTSPTYHLLPLARPKPFPSKKLVFLLPISVYFDLLAQPIFAAEIWSNCFSVCDSSIHPSGILFSGLFLEYFAAIGDRLSEFACLFYVRILSFDACLALLQIAIVVPFI